MTIGPRSAPPLARRCNKLFATPLPLPASKHSFTLLFTTDDRAVARCQQGGAGSTSGLLLLRYHPPDLSAHLAHRMTYRLCLAACLLALASLTRAETLPPNAQQEIRYLFSYLERSGCEFNRNGSWHSAQEASTHLRKKFAYLERHDLLSSAEDFIVGAASASSLSKQPYRVRCPHAPVVESGPWFTNALKAYRQSRTP